MSRSILLERTGFFGNSHQLLVQAVAVVASFAFSFVGSAILLKLTEALVGIRVSTEGERAGLDLSEHEESAYAFEA